MKNKLKEIEKITDIGERINKLENYMDLLSELNFFDPACGSGNFLTETYICLRRLENKALKLIVEKDPVNFFDFDKIKVSLNQFHGIEINDFAVAVANTALFISEYQMLEETQAIVHRYLKYLPLHSFNGIHEGNALRMNWNEVIPAEKCNYIMGNPPFSGARIMNKTSKEDVLYVFGKKWKHVGDLDYISCWFKKASDYMTGTKIKAAFVSTNSISQGMNITNLWKPLFDDGLQIDFAYESFKWNSESLSKAHVICVIIGFSKFQNLKPKIIFSETGSKIVNHINGYLLEGEDVYLEKRNKPICDVPSMIQGSFPLDKGHLLLSQKEYEKYIKKEPEGKKYIKPYMMGREFLHSIPRYCFWLDTITPHELNQLPILKKRVAEVKAFREGSKRKSTYDAKDRPHLFAALNQPKNNFIALPVVSSENRRYIPMDFLSKDIIIGNKLFAIPTDSLYIFGILNSNVHNAWMRVVTGRLEMRYSYSNTLVYNNFPWPNPTEKQIKLIEKTAQNILDVRNNNPGNNLSDFYDELTMPEDLRKAHRLNDRAVMKAYGWDWRNMTEEDCVTELMKLYQNLINS